MKDEQKPTVVLDDLPATMVPQKPGAIKKSTDIDGFIQKRQEFIEKVNAICVEGKDYHVIQGKKSLAKGGAEKIASIFNWNAQFKKDDEAIEMFGQLPGLVAFVCTLSRGAKFVGEGRGAASLDKNTNDPNKTLKMAQKSAFIDAVIRASGMSDFFTQDLEDMNPRDIGGYNNQNFTPTGPNQSSVVRSSAGPAKLVTVAQIGLIRRLQREQGLELSEDEEFMGMTTREASEIITGLKNRQQPVQGEVIN